MKYFCIFPKIWHFNFLFSLVQAKTSVELFLFIIFWKPFFALKVKWWPYLVPDYLLELLYSAPLLFGTKQTRMTVPVQMMCRNSSPWKQILLSSEDLQMETKYQGPNWWAHAVIVSAGHRMIMSALFGLVLSVLVHHWRLIWISPSSLSGLLTAYWY